MALAGFGIYFKTRKYFHLMTLTQIKSQKTALIHALKNGNAKSKHSVVGKIRQINKRIRHEERNVNFQNWLAQ